MMKKIVLFSGVMLLLLLASCTGKADSEISGSVSSGIVETSTPVDESVASSEDQPVVLSQGFVEYDESYLGETKDTVLFFHAEWCGSCKNAEADIIANGVPSDLTVLKVDFDSATELRQKYGVTTKHTFVQIDADGNMIKKWQGSAGISDIQNELEADTMMDKSEDTMEKDDAMMKKDEEGVMMDKSEDIMEKSDEVMQKDESVEASEVMTKELAGVYADYDASLVGKTDNTVIFFHAAWCPSCRAADDSISSDEIPENLTVLKADYDNAVDLRQKYGVVGQHTFVQIDADGNEVKKWLGGNSISDIEGRLN